MLIRIKYFLYVPPIPQIIEVAEPNIKLIARKISFKFIGSNSLCTHFESKQDRFIPHSNPFGLFLQISLFATTKSKEQKNNPFYCSLHYRTKNSV